MGESLIQQCRVGEEGLDCKILSSKRIMTVFEKEAPANFVPAAAVKRRGLVLLNLTGRKGREGCITRFFVNSHSQFENHKNTIMLEFIGRKLYF